jgi:hypothetical protein
MEPKPCRQRSMTDRQQRRSHQPSDCCQSTTSHRYVRLIATFLPRKLRKSALCCQCSAGRPPNSRLHCRHRSYSKANCRRQLQAPESEELGVELRRQALSLTSRAESTPCVEAHRFYTSTGPITAEFDFGDAVAGRSYCWCDALRTRCASSAAHRSPKPSSRRGSRHRP